MALIITGAVLLIIFLPLLLRAGVSCDYDGTLLVRLHIGPVSLRAYPVREKKRKPKKEGALKEKKLPAKRREGRKPDFSEALELFHIGVDAASKFRKRLVIERLFVGFTASGPDAAAAGITYGAAWAAYGGVMPVLERTFNIKSGKVDISLDYDAKKPYINVSLKITIRIWQILIIAISLAYGFLKLRTGNNNRVKRTV